MASEFIGAIVGALTGSVFAIINPDDDKELDNPRLLLLRARGGRALLDAEGNKVGEEEYEQEPMRMIKIPRGEYMAALSTADVAAIVEKLRGT